MCTVRIIKILSEAQQRYMKFVKHIYGKCIRGALIKINGMMVDCECIRTFVNHIMLANK